jgi:hypothetical protein
MPRYSKRYLAIHELGDGVITTAVYTALVKLFINDSDEEESDDEDIFVQTQTSVSAHFAAANSYRFLFRDSNYCPNVRMTGMGRGIPQWKQILLGHIYNDEEFLKIFRIPRESIMPLVELLKGHRSFGRNGLKQRRHFTPESHLLVLLKLLGLEDNAASGIIVKQGLGLGKGSMLNYVRRAVDTVLSLFSHTVFWPNAEE